MKMSGNHNHIDKNIEVYSHIHPDYSRTVEDVWRSMEEQIDLSENNERGSHLFYKKIISYVTAAVLLVIIGLSGFSYLYVKEVSTLKGQHLEVWLPDHSKVQLNAFSSIKYKPYWWRFNRDVELNGEAFFTVKKGDQFNVLTNNVNTQVLGTTFNVYSRKGKIRVACFSGKVKVFNNNEEVFLNPNESVAFSNDRSLEKNTIHEDNRENAWLNSEFYYESEPLDQVFFDLELQYDVEFEFDSNLNLSQLKYSGYYKKDHSIENVLNLVCKPFGIKYEKIARGKYHILYDN